MAKIKIFGNKPLNGFLAFIALGLSMYWTIQVAYGEWQNNWSTSPDPVEIEMTDPDDDNEIWAPDSSHSVYATHQIQTNIVQDTEWMNKASGGLGKVGTKRVIHIKYGGQVQVENSPTMTIQMCL